MSDTDGKKPLGLGGTPRSGSVKQSFSHGRTKSVVVETKRKRVVVPTTVPGKPAATGAATPTAKPNLGDPSKRPAGISDAEMERRLAALKVAKAREAEDTARRAAEDRERDERRERWEEEDRREEEQAAEYRRHEQRMAEARWQREQEEEQEYQMEREDDDA